MPRRIGLVLLSLMLIVTFGIAVAGCQQAPQTGGGGGEPIGAVRVMGVWGGSELENFQAVSSKWETETGGSMQFEGTRDLSAVLRARVSGGNPPDIAILPNPALLEEFAGAGDLKALDDMIDMNQLKQDYSQAWIDKGSLNGKDYGLFVKAATKSTVWYNPKTFSAKGYTPPTTWDELITLSNKMKADGTPPWSIGVEAGAASGFPASDWVQEIYLAENGPQKYEQWVKHEIPWTDPTVKSAFEKFGEIALTKGYVPGGVPTILSTNFQDATYLPYESPPKAQQNFLGAFAQGFIATQFPKLTPGTDYNFYKFVAINPQYKGSVTGGADVVVVFNDNASTRSFVQYLAKGDSWEPWAKAGGFSTPNKGLNPAAYPDEVAKAAAAQLVDASIFAFDADDSMPAEVQSAEWKGLLTYLQKPDQLDTILADIEDVAKSAYQAQ